MVPFLSEEVRTGYIPIQHVHALVRIVNDKLGGFRCKTDVVTHSKHLVTARFPYKLMANSCYGSNWYYVLLESDGNVKQPILSSLQTLCKYMRIYALNSEPITVIPQLNFTDIYGLPERCKIARSF